MKNFMWLLHNKEVILVTQKVVKLKTAAVTMKTWGVTQKIMHDCMVEWML